MTSSLVGSEMCIRDRCEMFENKKKRNNKAFYQNSYGAIIATLLQIPGPVSYTHLTLPTICSV
eukprot:1195484-Prorocentrum_lima.AAC.1